MYGMAQQAAETTESGDVAAFDGTQWSRERLDSLAASVAGESDREPLTVTAPAFGTEIGEIPRLEATAVHDAIERAREAQTEWAERSVADRAAVLGRFAELVEEHQDELMDLIQLETGKARDDALEEMIDPSIWAGYYAQEAESLLADERREPLVPGATTAEVVYDPVGVVGVISPWNYPLSLSFIDAMPALVAGNAVVIKPDDRTPYTAIRLAELFVEAGLPADLVQIVTGEGPEVGPALVERVDYITFTGSSETGRIVAEQAGRNLIDCSLELSGKNPMIVLEDADVDEAARGAIEGSFSNAGQICLSLERIYVHEEIYDEFLDEFTRRAEALEVGVSYGYGPDVGSIIDGTQLERVASHVEDARERGATVHTGGRERPEVGPHFYEPTVLTDVPEESLPACEETFGPVVTVYPVESSEEAVERANDSTHGLNASIFTGDRERGVELARELESGMVNVNDAYAAAYSAPGAPMGGVKDSGIGRRQGPEGIKRYVEAKSIGSSRIGPIGKPPLVPKRLYAWGTLTGISLLRRIRSKLP